MIIFINIVGGLPSNFGKLQDNLNGDSNLTVIYRCYSLLVYLAIVSLIVLVQDSYKRVNIVSARQLSFNSSEQNSQSTELKNSYIPIKLNQGGIMPLVLVQQ